MRHGNGKFENDTYEYSGQWQQDMKHGRGKYTKKKDGLPIFAPMENDKLNGLGKQGERTVLYKEGMEVSLSGNEFDCKKFYAGLYFMIFCGAFYTALFNATIAPEDESSQFYVLCIILYLVYQVISCQLDASKYLRNTMSTKALFEDVTKAIAAPPECIFKIQCYHYEERRDKNGNTKKVRVNTHAAKQ